MRVKGDDSLAQTVLDVKRSLTSNAERLEKWCGTILYL